MTRPFPPPATLLVTAAPAETRAVADALHITRPIRDWEPVPAPTPPGIWLLQTGVGKVNAAAGVLTALTRLGDPEAWVINLGICGALPRPGAGPLPLGSVVVATASVYADEGVRTPDAFQDLADLGFGVGGDAFAGSAIPTDTALSSRLHAALATSLGDVTQGRIATVSTCSGTDTLAADIAARTAAAAEAMEGAAIAHALARRHGQRVPFAEVRVVSNTTGDRARQRWDIKHALVRLAQVGAALPAALSE